MAATAELKAGTAEASLRTAVAALPSDIPCARTAVTETLETNGMLQNLRSKVRAGIYEALDSPQAILLG